MSNETRIPIENAYEDTRLTSTFNCTFDNIAELCRLYPKGKYVRSESIDDVGQFMNANVCLLFYPNGHKVASPNNCSLFLSVTPSFNMTKCFSVAFKITVIDDDGDTSVQTTGLVSQRSGFWPDFHNIIHNDKVIERLKVQVDLTIVTEKTHSRWVNLLPGLKEESPNTTLLRNHAIAFDNQSFDDDSMALVEVNGDSTKLLKVSKEIVCNVSDVFQTRLTKKEWKKETGKYQVYAMSGYDYDLVNKFFKAIHTGILTFDSLEDQFNLLEIAGQYNVNWIIQKVSELIEKSMELDNSIQYFIRADQLNAEELREKCFDFCVTNYHQLKVTEEWEEFTKDHNGLYVEILEDIASTTFCPRPSKRMRIGK